MIVNQELSKLRRATLCCSELKKNARSSLALLTVALVLYTRPSYVVQDFERFEISRSGLVHVNPLQLMAGYVRWLSNRELCDRSHIYAAAVWQQYSHVRWGATFPCQLLRAKTPAFIAAAEGGGGGACVSRACYPCPCPCPCPWLCSCPFGCLPPPAWVPTSRRHAATCPPSLCGHRRPQQRRIGPEPRVPR